MKLITTLLTVLGLSMAAPIWMPDPSKTAICEDWKLHGILASKIPLPFEQYRGKNSQIIDLKVTKDYDEPFI